MQLYVRCSATAELIGRSNLHTRASFVFSWAEYREGCSSVFLTRLEHTQNDTHEAEDDICRSEDNNDNRENPMQIQI